jgi:hypothetical protein
MLTELRNRWAMSRDVVKMSCLRYVDFDGYFASMHQSGNHWMRHLLGTVLALKHGLPSPEHLADMRLIGEPKCPTKIPGLPRLVFSHKICSPLVHSVVSRAFVKFPPYVIMVRDLRTMLVSHFERFKERYQISFSEFLQGDVTGRRFDCDIWDSIRFLNAWGRVCERLPKQTSVMRFEDLRADVVGEAMRVWKFLDLPYTHRSLFDEAAAASTKDKMKTKEERLKKQGTVIRVDGGDPLLRYSPKDRAFFVKTCRRYLQYPFGYDYSTFETAKVEAAPAIRRAA